jgi:type II secretory pathway component PulJ
MLSSKKGYYKGYYNNIIGFTLVEVMVALVLGLLVTTVVFVFYNTISSSGRSQNEISIIQNDLLAATDMIQTDIMNAGCNEKGVSAFSGYYAVYYTYSGAGSIRLQMDLDRNGIYSGNDEVVIYRINRTTSILERLYYNYNAQLGIIGWYTQPILKNVTNFDITYWSTTLNVGITPTADVKYPSTWTLPASDHTLTSTDAAKVQAVIVKITVRTDKKDPDTGDYIKRSVERYIKMRNR